ncbi:hypothetical protein Tco_1025845, partial [Tanacetum coccineum]
MMHLVKPGAWSSPPR